jgi:hypothetical protein
MPLEYLIKGKQGDSVYVSFTHTDNGQVQQVTVPFEVDTVIFDPKLRLVSKDNRVLNKADLIKASRSLHIYPNPFEETIKISFANTKWNNPVLVLYNMLGQQVKELNLSGVPYVVEWNMSDLPAGCYTLMVTSASGTFQEKIIKR